MFLVQFLLPLRDNAGQPFSPSDFERVRAELTDRFGGVTAFLQSPAAGAWQEGEGAQVREELVLFEVMVEKLERAFWHHYRAELERRFRQETLVVRALGVERL